MAKRKVARRNRFTQSHPRKMVSPETLAARVRAMQKPRHGVITVHITGENEGLLKAIAESRKALRAHSAEAQRIFVNMGASAKRMQKQLATVARTLKAFR